VDPLLTLTEHRPFPLPAGPWVMQQKWHDLLFAHWALAPDEVRPLVPAELELDLHEGKAWVAVTPFWMSGVRPRGFPALPWLSRFPELNVRTYVTRGGKPGVFFFSLDAARLPAVWAARVGFNLPYFHAQMKVGGTNPIEYSCRRRRLRMEAEFHGIYRPTGPAAPAVAGTLEHFLTERYCLYTVTKSGVYRAVIHHAPWALQPAEARIEKNTVAQAAGISLPEEPPHLLFSREIRVLVWLPERA
jgi:uncharacterized protein YqjF (DUF2071 family)